MLEIFKNIGANIVYYRLIKKMTQKQLAEKAGITNSFLSKLEHGQTSCCLETLFDLARALDIKLVLLFQNC